MKKITLLCVLTFHCTFSFSAEEKDEVTVIACHDSIVMTIVVIDEKSIVYVASNGIYSETEEKRGPVTVLRGKDIGPMHVVLAANEENTTLRQMRTEFGQTFGVLYKGRSESFDRVPFGIVPSKGGGFFAKFSIPRKNVKILPSSEDEFNSFDQKSVTSIIGSP